MLRHGLYAVAVFTCVLGSVQHATAEEVWRLESGKTTFSLNQNLLKGLGLGVYAVQAEALPPVDPWMEVPNWSFHILPESDLLLHIDTRTAPPYSISAGALRHDGSLVIVDEGSGQEYPLDGARIEFIAPELYEPALDNGDNALYMRDEKGDVVFELVHSMLHLEGYDKLRVYYLNMRIADSWARGLKRPELSGLVVGIAELQAGLEHLSGFEERAPFVPNFGTGSIDVKLGLLDNLQQAGRVGSAVGLTMATTSCNVGSADVPWMAPMKEDHPVIHMALYRLLDGRFEQIGISWLKHGFFALSSSQCTPCQNPSNGSFLGVGCSDTYGAGNNSDRRFLGPRSEVNPFIGTWECSGSHFQGDAADCVRGHSRDGHDAIDHRLVVEDSELDISGAQYFYEAYYVVRADIKRNNNWGSVETSMNLIGSTWLFTDEGPLIEAPALYRWGEQRTDIPIPADGKVVLAVQTSDLGGGTFHYQYALLNYDSDREIRSLSLPVENVANVTNFSFHDADEDAANDWAAAVNGGVLTWSTDTFAQDPEANALTFGEMFNFGFDADAAPATVTATLGLFMPPADETVDGSTLGPEAISDTTAPTPPVVTSSTHSPSAWSNNPIISAEWSGASDSSGIGGYSIEWDESPMTLPDETVDTPDTFSVSPLLADGVDYGFHVRTVDGAGNWTADAEHLGPFWIDTTPPLNPPIAAADRPPDTWSTNDTIAPSWSGAADTGFVASGVVGYSFVWDMGPSTIPDDVTESDSTGTSLVVPDGQSQYFHLRTVDLAGNAADPDSTIHLGPFWVDATPPQDPQTLTSDPAVGSWTQDQTVEIQWADYSDNLSGVDSFSHLFDQTAGTLPDTIPDPAPADSAMSDSLPDGESWFHLRTKDVAGNWTATVHAGPFQIDTTEPAGSFVVPGGGEAWGCDSTQTVEWGEVDETSGVQSVELRLSTDDGATFPTLIANPDPGIGSFDWTAPDSAGQSWRFQVELVDLAGNTATFVSEPFDVVCATTGTPDIHPVTEFRLGANIPNPFGSRTQIPYAVSEASHVNVSIWNASGRLVRTLVNRHHASGQYTASWDGRDRTGGRVASGIYYYRMKTPRFEQTRKLVLLR